MKRYNLSVFPEVLLNVEQGFHFTKECLAKPRNGFAAELADGLDDEHHIAELIRPDVEGSSLPRTGHPVVYRHPRVHHEELEYISDHRDLLVDDEKVGGGHDDVLVSRTKI
jgi:hypothetical protein